MLLRIGKFIYYILVFISTMMSLGMIVCVYSTHLSPAKYPIISSWGLIFPVFLVINLFFLVFWLLVKWRTAVIPLIAIISCWFSVRAYCPINIPQNPPVGSIKLLSFNTQAFGRYMRGDIRDNAIHQYIMRSNADIVCLQEVLHQQKEVKKYKFDDIYPYASLTVIPSHSRLAIFSKYPILDTELIDYPTKNNGSAIYHLLIDGDTVTVINNHLESYKLKPEDKEKYGKMLNEKDLKKDDSKMLLDKITHADSLRALQADVIYDLVSSELRQHDAVIVCGDFNDPPVSYVHHRLTRLLHDAFAESGNGLSFSYHDNKMFFRIDHILCSSYYDSYASKVDKSIKLSDHYPIYTYIKKKTR